MSQTFARRFLLSCLCILTVLVYQPGLQGGFIFDDYPNIVHNVALHVDALQLSEWIAAAMSSPAANLPRPIAMLSFAVRTPAFPWLCPCRCQLP